MNPQIDLTLVNARDLRREPRQRWKRHVSYPLWPPVLSVWLV
jgi:hypothetical protein